MKNHDCGHDKSKYFYSRIALILSICIFVGSLIFDLHIRKCPGWPYFYVSSDYVGILFGGLCTVATLGSAIQSVIIGAYNNKVLGFSLRDLISFSAYRNNPNMVVYISLISVIFAIPALAFNLCTAITVITVWTLLFMIYSNLQIWCLITNYNCAIKIIKKQIYLQEISASELFFNAWFPELQDAIVKNNSNDQNMYIQLIKAVVNRCNDSGVDISNILKKYFSKIFSLASFHLGFVEAYQKVLCLNGPRDQVKADLDTVVWEYIEEIQYSTENNIQNYRIVNTILSIC